MLNLVVESAVEDVIKNARRDVSRRGDLLVDVIKAVFRREDGHAVVIGRKNKSHIDAEKQVICDEEIEGLGKRDEMQKNIADCEVM